MRRAGPPASDPLRVAPALLALGGSLLAHGAVLAAVALLIREPQPPAPPVAFLVELVAEPGAAASAGAGSGEPAAATAAAAEPSGVRPLEPPAAAGPPTVSDAPASRETIAEHAADGAPDPAPVEPNRTAASEPVGRIETEPARPVPRPDRPRPTRPEPRPREPAAAAPVRAATGAAGRDEPEGGAGAKTAASSVATVGGAGGGSASAGEERGGEESPGFAPGTAANPLPHYPSAARRRGIEGTVVLAVAVDPTGLPERVAIARSSGSALLDQAALEAVRRWRFRPARRAGEPVPGEVAVPITFRLVAANSE